MSLTWEEIGGPPVAAPSRRGFGRMLLERAAGHDLDGEVEIEYRPKGLRYRLSFPLWNDAGHDAAPLRDLALSNGDTGIPSSPPEALSR